MNVLAIKMTFENRSPFCEIEIHNVLGNLLFSLMGNLLCTSAMYAVSSQHKFGRFRHVLKSSDNMKRGIFT